jgi:predicted glycoside hydrolase/deacetylase ChbG (UPF0249 family)
MTTNSYSIPALNELKEKIEKIDTHHHIHLLKIINNYKCKISENKNGVFINMSILPDVVLKEFTEYLSYIEEQTTTFKTAEYQKEEFKKSFFCEKQDKDIAPISYNTII